MIIPNGPRALRFLARTWPGLAVLGLAAAATTAAVPASASTVAREPPHRHPDRHLADRQLRGTAGRPPARRHGSPFTGQGLGQLGAEFSPARPSQLFVSNAHNGTGLGTISAYRDAFSGHLTSIGSSPFADGQTAPCWVRISHDGTYLFTVNTGSGTVSSYSIKPNGSLVLIGSFTIKGGGASIDARLSPTASTCWSTALARISSPSSPSTAENLTEIPSSPTPLPAGATSSSGIVNT